MTPAAPPERRTETLRLAELMAALSLATDLGMGQPMEQALRTCLLATHLARRLGLADQVLSDVYYTALLRFVGCTGDAFEVAAYTGGDDLGFRALVAPVLNGQTPEFLWQFVSHLGEDQALPRRAGLVAGVLARGRRAGQQSVLAHCEVGERLAQRLALSPGVRRGLQHALERWDGKGLPAGVHGEEVAVTARVVQVARDAEIFHRIDGLDASVTCVRRRRGAAYDPAVADAFVGDAAALLATLDAAPVWEAVLQAEPEPRPWVPQARLATVLTAFADFADIKSPFTHGHSRAVGTLAETAARLLGRPEQEAVALRHAGLVHDLGRSGVPNGIWDKPGALAAGEWERVRLHPYYTERILSRSTALASLAALAGCHHERLNGSGYHRAAQAAALSPSARLLAAADAYQAMTQERPHRPALAPAEAARQLGAECQAGRLDRSAAQAVLEAAGQPDPALPASWPAGLSEREVEVLRLIAAGRSKRQAAAELHLSASTVDHHVRHIYEKIGVQTRAGAAVYALEHDLFQK